MSETESTYFDNMKAETVNVELMDEMLAAIREIGGRGGMDDRDAIRFVLASGLAYLEGDRALQTVSADGCAGELERVSKEMARYYAQYAVMKFKAFSLMQVARIQEMNVSGLRVTEQGLKGVVERLREEKARLAEENEALKQKLNPPSTAGRVL